MALGETAELAVRLTLNDRMSGPLRNASGALRGFETRTGLVSKGLGNLAQNSAKLAAVGVAGLVTQVKFGIDSLRELDALQAQTQAVITSTGGAAGYTAGEIRKMAEELESLTTIDDKAIQSAQNLLLTYTNIGREAFPAATQAALDMSTALGTDLDSAALQLGKALNDPVKGLSRLTRLGVTFTKEQEKQIKTLAETGDLLGAQTLILDELSRKYGGSASAAANTFDGRMRRVGDAVEDAQKALAVGFLPVIEKVADRLGTFLGDEANLRRIEQFGRTLASGLDDLIEIGGKLPWKTIGDSLAIAGAGAKAVLSAFTSLPPWVQTAVLTGWGLNKLTGGALGGIVGELGKGLIKGVLGMNAGVVNINAGVVNGGGGGIPNVAKVGGMGLGMAAGIGSAAFIGGLAISAFIKSQSGQSDAEWNQNIANTYSRMGGGDGTVEVKGALLTEAQEQTALLGDSRQAQITAYRQRQAMVDKQADALVAFRESERASASGLDLVARKTTDLGGKVATIGAAIRAMPPPKVNVTVPVNLTTKVSVTEVYKTQQTYLLYKAPSTIQHQ